MPRPAGPCSPAKDARRLPRLDEKALATEPLVRARRTGLLGRLETAFYLRPRAAGASTCVYEVRNVWGAVYWLFCAALAISFVVWLSVLTAGMGLDWHLAILVMMGLFSLMSLYRGARLLARRRTLVLDRKAGTVELAERGLSGRQTSSWKWSDALLRVQPTTLSYSRGGDWKGYTLFIQLPDARFSIARTRDEDRIHEVAREVAEQLGLPPAEDGEPVSFHVGYGEGQTE